MKVAAIFGDAGSMQRALERLQSAGLGDDVVRVYDGSTPNTTEDNVGGTDPYAGIGIVQPLHGGSSLPGAAVVNQSSRSSPIMTDMNAGHHSFDDMGEAGDYFSRAISGGGYALVLETSEVAQAVDIMNAADAQQVYDPRGR